VYLTVEDACAVLSSWVH